MLGYASFGDSSPETIAFVQGFAAGAILTMLADTMMPEAFENGGPVVGLATTVGFSLAFLIATLEGKS
jgi:zinc transporter, ZIP family